jgi:hypothetical protein
LAGAAPSVSNPALASSDQTAYAEFSGVIRKIFKKRVWLALSGAFSRQFDHRTYTNTEYFTADAPTFNIALFVGVRL